MCFADLSWLLAQTKSGTQDIVRIDLFLQLQLTKGEHISNTHGRQGDFSLQLKSLAAKKQNKYHQYINTSVSNQLTCIASTYKKGKKERKEKKKEVSITLNKSGFEKIHQNNIM